jgi:hypothetical protein
MPSTLSGSSAEPETFAGDLAGMGSFFIDPAGAARRVFHRWFWIAPLIVFSIVSATATYLMMPMVQHALEVSPIPAGASPDQYQRGMDIALTFQRISMYFSPVIVAVILVLQALVVFATCSVLTINLKFRWIFNLVAGCSLIQVPRLHREPGGCEGQRGDLVYGGIASGTRARHLSVRRNKQRCDGIPGLLFDLRDLVDRDDGPYL